MDWVKIGQSAVVNLFYPKKKERPKIYQNMIRVYAKHV